MKPSLSPRWTKWPSRVWEQTSKGWYSRELTKLDVERRQQAERLLQLTPEPQPEPLT